MRYVNDIRVIVLVTLERGRIRMRSGRPDKYGACVGSVRQANTSGYTLIEVLLAMSILAVGLLAVASMQVSAIRVNSTAQDITERITMAQDRIEELVALPYNSPWLETAGNPPGLDSAGNTHLLTSNGYTISWTTAQGPTGDANTTLITVSVSKGGKTSRVRYVKPEVAN